MTRAYCLFDTAIGVCGIAWGPEGLLAVQLPEADPAGTERRLRDRCGGEKAGPPEDVAAYVADLQAYFAGEPVDFRHIALDWGQARSFDRPIYRALREVPFGRTLTYGELAERTGLEGAAQAIGAAMSRNPWPIVVPCHRVVAASGRLGGFSAYQGTRVKRKLLAMECATRENEPPLLPGLFGSPAAK